MATPLYLNINNGIFEGSIKSNNKIITSPETLFSSYPLDSVWQQNGTGWTTTDNNKVTFNNTTSSNNFLNAIDTINQTVAKQITFRIIAKGETIASFGTGFSISLVLSNASGPSGTEGVDMFSSQINFLAGTWSEQQFSITVNPLIPMKYLYAYIFTRNTTGKLTFWNAEVFQDGDTARTNGRWSSTIQDLAKVTNSPITSGNISLKNVYFYYGDLANVDGMNNVAYSIDKLSKADIVVTHEPSQLNTRQSVVVNALIASGVKIYGYAQVGPFGGELLSDLIISAKAIMDRCQISNYYGVFFDMFGYDWGVDRISQNILTDYAHTTLLNVFANAWIPDDCLSSVVNATYNPTGIATHMTTDDWVLLESFYCNSSGYAGYNIGGFSEAFKKYTATVSLATPLGINVCGLAYSFTTTSLSDFRDWVNTYILAVGLKMQGYQYTSAIENDSLSWPIEIFTPPNIGTTLVSSFVQVDQNTYEAKTNSSIIQFIAIDSPVIRNYKSFIIPISIDVIEFLPQTNASRVNIIHYSSADKITWSELSSLDGITNRYFKTEISIRY